MSERPNLDVDMPITQPFTLEVELSPADAEIDFLRQRLREFNISRAGEGGYRAFLIRLLDHNRRWTGGLFGSISRGWLFVDTLWVSEESRGKGNGRLLLESAENQARSFGCANAWVDTFSFQARGFYEKSGYSLFGELPDYPPGHTRYFLRKRL